MAMEMGGWVTERMGVKVTKERVRKTIGLGFNIAAMTTLWVFLAIYGGVPSLHGGSDAKGRGEVREEE